MEDYQKENTLGSCSGNGCEHLRIKVVQPWQHSPAIDLKVVVRNLSVEDIKFKISWNGILGGGVEQTYTINGNGSEEYTAPNRLVGATITSAKIIDTNPS